MSAFMKWCPRNTMKGTVQINRGASSQDNTWLKHIDNLLITVTVCTADSMHKVCFDAKKAGDQKHFKGLYQKGILPVWCESEGEVWKQDMAGNLSTKHLSTGRLAASRQKQTWLNLYLKCQQLNYYTAQREYVCVCVFMCVYVCGPAQ